METQRESVVERKQLVAEILNIPVSNKWDIHDFKDDYALVHYNEFEAGSEKFPNIRGAIIDMQLKEIVVPGNSFIPRIVCSGIPKDLVLKDGDQNVTLEDAKFEVGIEGTMLRCWRDRNGETRYSTHKKINASSAKWGDTNFKQIYDDAGGIDPYLDVPADSPALLRSFLLSVKQCRLITRTHVAPGIYDMNDTKFINILEANRALSGNHEFDGEFVLVTCANGKKYKLMSRGYRLREKIRGKDSDPYISFVELATYAAKPEAFAEKKFKLYNFYSMQDIINQEHVMTYWKSDRVDPKTAASTYENRLYHLWVAFMLAISPDQQRLARRFYNRYMEEKYRLVKFLESNKPPVKPHPRVTKLREIAAGWDKKDSYSLSRFISKEYGSSFVSMMKVVPKNGE